MLYPFWHELAIRFLDAVVIGIWFVGHFAAMKRKPATIRTPAVIVPADGNQIPFHDYAREPRHGS